MDSSIPDEKPDDEVRWANVERDEETCTCPQCTGKEPA